MDFVMKTLIALKMEHCIACHFCSLACAGLVHKHLSWDKAGIRIISSGGLSTDFEAKTCLACDPRGCEFFYTVEYFNPTWSFND